MNLLLTILELEFNCIFSLLSRFCLPEISTFYIFTTF